LDQGNTAIIPRCCLFSDAFQLHSWVFSRCILVDISEIYWDICRTSKIY
jgi:hypothetical protein